MMENPLVSIIIPVYNGANFLAEAIDSALAQTYPNIEVLVINDGSNDNGATEQTALSYEEQIRYFSKPNGGVSSALNMGIRQMRGEYFSWLSHDDLYTPNKIETQIKILKTRQADQREVVLMCALELIDETGEKIPRPTRILAGEFTGLEIFKECQKGLSTVLNGCGMLVPKSILNRVGFFDETLRYIQDYEYWYRIMIAGYSFVCTQEANVLSRIHAGQVTSRFPELYYVESEIVAKSLFQLFFSHAQYRFFLECYLCGCCRDLNPVAKNAAKQLKSKKELTIQLRVKMLWYYFIGYTGKLLKKIYHFIFFKNKR